MNSPHIIRLRGPWQRRVLSGKNRGDLTTVQVPSSWVDDLGADFCGEVEYSRFFNRPTGIDKATSIGLVFQEIVGDGIILLNGTKLDETKWPDYPHRVDLADKLEGRNELLVRVTTILAEEMRSRDPSSNDVAASGLVGEVHLEIG